MTAYLSTSVQNSQYFVHSHVRLNKILFLIDFVFSSGDRFRHFLDVFDDLTLLSSQPSKQIKAPGCECGATRPLPRPTFANIPVRGALELPCTQQEAGPVVRVALTAGVGAQAPGGRAALVSQDLVDGGAVFVGQSCCACCCIPVLLGV